MDSVLAPGEHRVKFQVESLWIPSREQDSVRIMVYTFNGTKFPEIDRRNGIWWYYYKPATEDQIEMLWKYPSYGKPRWITEMEWDYRRIGYKDYPKLEVKMGFCFFKLKRPGGEYDVAVYMSKFINGMEVDLRKER